MAGVAKAVWCVIAEGFQGLHYTSSTKSNAGPHGGGPRGAVRDTVAVCEHQLCEEVRRLEAKQQYTQCITTLETLLVSLVRARGVEPLETKLWKQLVVTCNAFASRCVDYKKFAVALQLVKQAERLLHNSILVDDAMRLELLAYLYDTYAHYYYRRGKSHAGLQYMFKAHDIHTRQSSWTHLAKCRLHIANLLSVQSKHNEAMEYMASILALIEEKKLEDPHSGSPGDGASAQKICLAAVCYNNMAVEQLHLRQFEAASVSAGNAKRLARLCLGYSNRWLAQFGATSNCVDLAIATLMEDVNATANAPYKS
jgi:tetratricopeptide (TPR) repeat protein